jgi:putative transposon-encoded protein
MPRRIVFKSGDFAVTESVEVVYEGKVTSFGDSAKVGAPKKFIGKRAYVVILKD